MQTENIAKNLLMIGFCFTLTFIFIISVSAQKNKKDKTASQDRELVRPKQTETTQPKTTTTKPDAKKETVKPDSTPRKKIIVILDFDNVSIECRNDIYGKNVANQLSAEFSQTGNYTVIEKQRRDDIFEQINVSQDERFDARTAAKVGKALSASGVVLGTINECNTKVRNVGIPGARYKTVTIKVSLTIRLADINTGEIMDAVKTTQTADEKGGNFGGFGSETEITSDVLVGLFNKAVGKAVKDSVSQLTAIIEGRVSPNVAKEKIPTDGNGAKNITSNVSTSSKPKVSSFAKVATVVGTTVYVTGLGQDVKVGDLFSVIRGVEIKNPDTGEVVDFDGNEIAKIEVIEVRENTVKAKIIQGKGIKEKDIVKPIQ